jgi:hypothetical protein
MMEWWNNGVLGIKTEIILILTSDLENGSKKDLILMNPLFQHFSIPSLQTFVYGIASCLDLALKTRIFMFD